MENRKQRCAFVLAGLVALLSCLVGSLDARAGSPPLRVALASVFNVNEMSERGPLPRLAIYPDGRVMFPTIEGDYRLVRYTIVGANLLVADLRSALTPRPFVPASSSDAAVAEGNPVDPNTGPPTLFVDNCPSDVGEIEVAFFGEQPKVAFCERDSKELERIFAVLSAVVSNTATGRISDVEQPAMFASYAVIARLASRGDLGKSPRLPRWQGPKLNIGRGLDASCTIIKGSPKNLKYPLPMAWQTSAGPAYLSIYPIVDEGKWCRKSLPPPGQMTSAESQIYVAEPAKYVPGEIQVRFTGKLAKVHGGSFVVREFRSGKAVAFLRVGSGNTPPSFTTDPAQQVLLDNGLLGPGPQILRLPPSLIRGRYELCQDSTCALVYL
jgi:hypothetical protein